MSLVERRKTVKFLHSFFPPFRADTQHVFLFLSLPIISLSHLYHCFVFLVRALYKATRLLYVAEFLSLI